MNEDWRKFETESSYYVNKNVQKYGIEQSNTDFSKRGKALWVMIPMIIFVLIVAGVMMFAHSFIVGIPALLVLGALYVWILRKFVFDENNVKKLAADNALKSEFGIGSISNILKIDDDGQIFYQTSEDGLKTGYLVTFDYSSILDNSLSATKYAIDGALVPFMKMLHESNLKVCDYDISISHTISSGTLKQIKQTRSLQEGSWLKLIEMLQNELISSLEQNSNDNYRHYFLIHNNDMRNVARLRQIVSGIVNSTLGNQTSIVNARICDLDEISEFLVNYYNISSFELGSVNRNIKRMDISKFFNFVSVFDINGIRYSLDSFDDNKGLNQAANRAFDLDAQAKAAERNINRNLSKEQDLENKKKNAEKLRKQQASKVNRSRKSTIGVSRKNNRRNVIAEQKREEIIAKKKERQNVLTEQAEQKKRGIANLTMEDMLNMARQENDDEK